MTQPPRVLPSMSLVSDEKHPSFGVLFNVLLKQSLQSQLAGQKTMARKASLSQRRRSTVSRSAEQGKRNPAQNRSMACFTNLARWDTAQGTSPCLHSKYGSHDSKQRHQIGHARRRPHAESRVVVSWKSKEVDHYVVAPALSHQLTYRKFDDWLSTPAPLTPSWAT